MTDIAQHPKVKLVSYSKPTVDYQLQGLENVQDLIAYCAKVSNPSNQINKETSERLIKYLIEHQHWSPLEMVNACLEINTTRDIAHQIVRHRSFSFQEFSQRYADPTTMEDWYEMREARLQDVKNRQNSLDTDDMELQIEWFKKQGEVQQAAERAYQWAIDNDIAKEQARVVLPQNTYTSWIWTGSLYAFSRVCNLRCQPDAQLETQEICWEIDKLSNDKFPVSWEALR